ncbi:IMP dehydrogenase [Salmonella enterica]|uniref:IMP dehydrogenase n=1 Tax=Salmonella enterica TaxID=28901 RepID=UPI000B54654E|nr:IMP dehydrogenase [Salmonella enterica]ASG11051.1 inositol-5-monophosphate dehydrogenase [Salmonella enterica subsp. enterica serovar Ouakam str. SA20034636]
MYRQSHRRRRERLSWWALCWPVPKNPRAKSKLYQGRSYKSYRGMGSLGAMSKGSSDRYFQSDNAADKLVPEGIEGRVAYKGRLKRDHSQQMGGLRSCMGLTGCATIDENCVLKRSLCVSAVRAFRKSHVHDVTITKESPNYRLGS